MTRTNNPDDRTLVKAATPSAVVVDAHVDGLVRYFSTKIDDGMLATMPTQAERAVIARTAADLFASMRPISMAAAESKTAATLLAQMFTGYPNLKQDPLSLVSAYVAHLREMPLFAIARACEEVRDGTERAQRAHVSPAFPPTAAQMAQICADVKQQTEHRYRQATAVLEAKQLPPLKISERERAVVGQKMAAFSLQLADTSIEQQERDARREAGLVAAEKAAEKILLKEYAAAGIEPYKNRHGVLVSLTLMESLGATVEVIEGKKFFVMPSTEEATPAMTGSPDESRPELRRGPD